MRKLVLKAPLLIQATGVFERARKLPLGPARNDLRQLARGLVNLNRLSVKANVQIVDDHPSR
jgi:hypothetical protein